MTQTQIDAFRSLLTAKEDDTYTEELELDCIRFFSAEVAEVLLETVEIDSDVYVGQSDDELAAYLEEVEEEVN